MLKTTNENITQAAYDRIADTERHLRRHGPALCNLFNAFDAPAAFNALCDLHGIFGNQHPDATVIKKVNRPWFTGGQNFRRIAHYGTVTQQEDLEAV
ncbi:hypothetical protein LCGC14_3167290, partial [marine sediment metagenome]